MRNVDFVSSLDVKAGVGSEGLRNLLQMHDRSLPRGHTGLIYYTIDEDGIDLQLLHLALL